MDPAVLRDDLVDGLVHESKGVLETPRLERAMRAVPREAFLEDERRAYADRSFERHGTTVLAPRTVARLLEALEPEPGDRVLVVGAGVGYTAAVIAEVVGSSGVHAVDIARPLVQDARRSLSAAGYGDVLVDRRDGSRGLPGYAPFDRILLEAAAVRPPAALLEQLAPGGRLVLPEGTRTQSLVAVDHEGERAAHGRVAFRPLLVEGEQAGALERNRTRREDAEHARGRAERRRGWEHDWITWE